MKTYSTYQEAKIENPIGDIYVNKMSGMFSPDLPQWLSSCWIVCNPADYCMTVEKFLGDGNKFDVGDVVFIGGLGSNPVQTVSQPYRSNLSTVWGYDSFILRAAALEKKESDYDRGMREAMQAIAKSCGRTFAVDVGYADLPALVESMVNPVKKPRTHVEYVSVTDANPGDELFAKSRDSYHPVLVIGWHPLHPVVVCEGVEESIDSYAMQSLYRKVETEIDERQEFIDAAYYYFQTTGVVTGTLGKMFDSGKFKYIGGDDEDK